MTNGKRALRDYAILSKFSEDGFDWSQMSARCRNMEVTLGGRRWRSVDSSKLGSWQEPKLAQLSQITFQMNLQPTARASRAASHLCIHYRRSTKPERMERGRTSLTACFANHASGRKGAMEDYLSSPTLLKCTCILAAK